jgi:hypothetical protein
MSKAYTRYVIPMIVILVAALTAGCSRHVRPEYSGHPAIYCGWLDFKEGDYKKVGYQSRAEWKVIIERINVYFLQKHITDYCGSFKVIGAVGKAETPPAGAYHIKFNVLRLDEGATTMTVEVKIIDSNSRRTLTTFTISPSGVRSMAGVTLMGRMSMMCQQIAEAVSVRLYE